MDQVTSELAEYLVQQFAKFVSSTCPRISTQSNLFRRAPNYSRLLVGISGVPASGKSTLSRLLVNKVNALLREQPSVYQPKLASIAVGLDGWHFTRAQLDAFPDPKLAHDRRGAHWTFDGESYIDYIRRLRQPLPPPVDVDSSEASIIDAPSFSHELKDPAPRSVLIYPYHRLVIIEGLYTFLSVPPWREAGELLDERWWVDISEEDAERRLVPRHLKSGICKDLDEAEWRARENDAPSELSSCRAVCSRKRDPEISQMAGS